MHPAVSARPWSGSHHSDAIGAPPATPGAARFEVLAAASTELTELLRGYTDLINIENGYASGKPQLDFQLKDRATALGLTNSDIARQIRVSGRAYPVFDIARLVMKSPERFLVEFSVRRKGDNVDRWLIGMQRLRRKSLDGAG